MALIPVLQEVKNKFSNLVTQKQLGNQKIKVTIEPLSPKQAIGSPIRQDFPILEGKEVIVEAMFGESFGQAFTDQPQSFNGTIHEVLNLRLDTSSNRAIFISSINAVTSYFGIVKGVRHCRDEEPEKCGCKISNELKDKYGSVKIGMVGLQPAILQNLSQSFGIESVRCTDLNSNNIGSYKFGIKIQDGKTDAPQLINWCDILLVTSSSIANGTFDEIHMRAVSAGKQLLLFGITGAAVCTLAGLKRICPFGH